MDSDAIEGRGEADEGSEGRGQWEEARLGTCRQGSTKRVIGEEFVLVSCYNRGG